MNQRLFITGAGTEIGKTYIGAHICRMLRERGVPIRALKPVQSGFEKTELEHSDAGKLLAACGQTVSTETVSDICPWSFVRPLAPNLAAKAEGHSLSYTAVREWLERQLIGDQPLLVEGAGGVMSPLTDDKLQLDLLLDLDLPVLLVSGAYLGAISHALTALEVLKSRGATVAAVAVNANRPGPLPIGVLANEIERHTDVSTVPVPFSTDEAAGGPSLDALREFAFEHFELKA